MAALAFVATPFSRSVRHQMVGCEWVVISKASLSLLEITWQRGPLLSNRPLQGCWDGTARRSRRSPMDWRRDASHHPCNLERDLLPQPFSTGWCTRYLYWGRSCFYFRGWLMNRCQPGVFSLKNIWCVHFYPQRLASDLMALEGCLNGDGQDTVSIPTALTRNWGKSSIMNWASCLTIWIIWTVSANVTKLRGPGEPIRNAQKNVDTLHEDRGKKPREVAVKAT